MKVLKSTAKLAILALSACGILSFASCKENVDESNFKIANKPTIFDLIASRDSLSSIRKVFERVKLGNSKEASTLASVLSARGYYTCFAPSNRALEAYVDSVTQGTSTDVAALTPEQAKHVAYSCIIDKDYETANFPLSGETFQVSTLSNRRLVAVQDSTLDYIVNQNSRILDADNEASNGYLHIVDHVVSPSTLNLHKLISEAPNMRIFSSLLSVTGWADSLQLHTEEEEEYLREFADLIGTRKQCFNWAYPYPDSRAINFTAFVEPDDLYEKEWGIHFDKNEKGFIKTDDNGNISNWENILKAIEAKCLETGMGKAECIGEYTNPDNPLNDFIAYHLLIGGMAPDEFVRHYNEKGYDYVSMREPQNKNYTVNVWDYFETVKHNNKQGLVKITQLPDGDCDYYLNRISTYDDKIDGTYEELGIAKENKPGKNGLNVRINRTNVVNGKMYENNALNGFYFPVDHMYIYNEETRKGLGSERIRANVVTTVFPEVVSNDCRGRKITYYPRGYARNIYNQNEMMNMYYALEWDSRWPGGQRTIRGENVMLDGRMDFTFKLPPVPASGTYELRIGALCAVDRGMFQYSIGEDPNRLKVCGLPVDYRESIALIPGQPWVPDGELDEETILMNDRNLRYAGYIKAPKYYCVSGSAGRTDIRNSLGSGSTPFLRRIITRQHFEAGKPYYMRMKCVLNSTNIRNEFSIIEFCPKSIYSSEKPEDVW